MSVVGKMLKEEYEKAMKAHGYVIIAQDGWVVKKMKDGTIKKLCRIK